MLNSEESYSKSTCIRRCAASRVCRTVAVTALVAAALMASVRLWAGPVASLHPRALQVSAVNERKSVQYYYDGAAVDLEKFVDKLTSSKSANADSYINSTLADKIHTTRASAAVSSQRSGSGISTQAIACNTSSASEFGIGTILQTASEAAKACNNIPFVLSFVRKLNKACDAVSAFDTLFLQNQQKYWFIMDCLASDALTGPATFSNFYAKTSTHFDTEPTGQVYNLRGSTGVQFQEVTTNNQCRRNYFISAMFDLASAQKVVGAVHENLLNLGATDVEVEHFEINARAPSNMFDDWIMKTGYILVPDSSSATESRFTTCQANLVPQPSGCVHHPEGMEQWLQEVQAAGETIVKPPELHQNVYMLKFTLQPADGGASTSFGITAGHYLPLGCGSELVPASKLVVGDELCLHGKPAKVSAIEQFWGQGYNMKTLSSAYTVNGVSVSHFASKPTTAQFYFERVVNLYRLASSWF